MLSAKAGAFLRIVLPYLIIKAPHADAALRFRETTLAHPGPPKGRRSGGTANPVTDELFAYRESLRREIQALNRRGVAA